MRVFVLGAPDPEMHAIEALLTQRGESVVYAFHNGRRVDIHHAYEATDVSPALPEGKTDIVFIECSVMGLRYADLIDHHRPGDPGYDMPPGQYMEGSSLGQLLAMLGVEPSDEQRVICAADHCLGQAYQGLCPGVEPEALKAWRAQCRATHAGISVDRFERQVEDAHRRLLAAEKIEVEGQAIAWVGDMDREYGEASARFNIPFMGTHSLRQATMVTVFGAAPAVIRAWMKTCGLKKVFGAPERGYAGGYTA
jgi:hypothetical protein